MLAVAIASVAFVVGVAPAVGAVPAPAVFVEPASAHGESEVFGVSPSGDVFANTGYTLSDDFVAVAGGGEGVVRHPDGSTTPLGVRLHGSGVIGPDGRLWLPQGGSLWSFAVDGTATEHPITLPEATATSGLVDVELGADGRIWFLDAVRHSIGSLATDGTGITIVPIPGGTPTRMAPGPDGRMWVLRSGAPLAAVAADGGVTTYPQATGISEIRATAADLYGLRQAKLVRIDPSGGLHVLASSGIPSEQTRSVAADGWVWFTGEEAVVAVSPSGRVASFAMPIEWFGPSDGFAPGFVPGATGGLVGSLQGWLMRVPSAAVDEVLSASVGVRSSKGVNVLHVVARGRTPGGRPLSGPVDVALWNRRSVPPSNTLRWQGSTIIGRIQLVDGVGTADIPITPMLLRSAAPRTGGDPCCRAVVRRPGVELAPGMVIDPGLSSQLVASATPMAASATTRWLDDVHHRTLERDMDTPGMVWWAGRVTAGTPRVSLTRELVATTTWRVRRVIHAYRRWFDKAPDAKGMSYWQRYLATHSTSQFELAIAGTAAARDAGGTTNAQRARHLASALHLPSRFDAGFQARLDAGERWTTVLRDAYWGDAAVGVRITEMGPRSAATPDPPSLAAELRRSGDERGPLSQVLAALPTA